MLFYTTVSTIEIELETIFHCVTDMVLLFSHITFSHIIANIKYSTDAIIASQNGGWRLR